MTTRRLFNPPRTVQVTRSVTLAHVQRNDCDGHASLNDLACHLCGEPVGTARPLGIGWGVTNQDRHPQGIRLCYQCYLLALEEKESRQSMHGEIP
jgi:hypothetical protein